MSVVLIYDFVSTAIVGVVAFIYSIDTMTFVLQNELAGWIFTISAFIGMLAGGHQTTHAGSEMKEYTMTTEGLEDIAVSLEAEDNNAAIEKAKKSMPGLKNIGNVWNLYEVSRDDPERHNMQDDKGGFYEVFVTQLISDYEGNITLAG